MLAMTPNKRRSPKLLLRLKNTVLIDSMSDLPNHTTPHNPVTGQSVLVPKVTVDWYRSTPWWRLVSHTLAISWRASHLALCAVALLVTQAFVGVSGLLFMPQEHAVISPWTEPVESNPAIHPWANQPRRWLENLENAAPSSDRSSNGPPLQWFDAAPDSYLSVWRRYASYPFDALDGLTLGKSVYFLWNILGLIAIWSLVGGLLARRSVQELGMHVTAPWLDTVRWVLGRWRSIVWSVLMPLCLVLMFALVPWILGWISNIPLVGRPVSMVLRLPVALMALGVGWVAAISLFGFPLATVAIVTEKQADAFDGMSRASAYLFQRPATLFLAILAAQWLGHFGGSIVSIVLNTGYNIVAQAFALSASASPGFMDYWTDPLISGIVPLLVTAFGFSFFWTASTAIYLVLRKDIDRAEFDLIDMGSSDLPKSLPRLAPAPESANP